MKMEIREIIFWLLVAYVILYGIGKGLGLFSPEWIDTSPLVATGIMVAYLRLYIKKDIESAFDKSLTKFEKEFNKMRDRTIEVVTRGEVLTELMKKKVTEV